MTLRTITSPYDLQTLAEIRGTVAVQIGRAYDDWDTTFQTEVNRIIDGSFEYLIKRFGHEPWFQIEDSLSLASGTAILTLSASVRHVILITETYESTTRVADMTTKRDWMMQWGHGFDTHPWSTQEDPHWFYDGMTGDNPPQQQWKRVPTPNQTVTGTALCRPYLTLLGTTGDTQYTHVPANAATAATDYILYRVSKLKQNWEAMQVHKAAMEDEMNALDVADNPDEGHEGPVTIDLPTVFKKEMTLSNRGVWNR